MFFYGWQTKDLEKSKDIGQNCKTNQVRSWTGDNKFIKLINDNVYFLDENQIVTSE